MDSDHATFGDELQELLSALGEAEHDGERRFGLFLSADRERQVKVKMYQERRHARPHVHVDYGRGRRHEASYSLDGDRLAGTLDQKLDRAVKDWIAKHRDRLLQIWDALRAGREPDPLTLGEVSGWV